MNQLSDLRQLTTLQLDECYDRAKKRVERHLGERPTRAKFQRELGRLWTVLDVLAVVVFIAALIVSSIHIVTHIGALASDDYTTLKQATSGAHLKDEVGQKCEECGVPNGEYIYRRLGNPRIWISALDETGESAWGRSPEQWTINAIKVVLTTARLDHNPSNNDRSNLRVLCQRCHLVYDCEHHHQNARKTRIRKKHQAKRESGQLVMFGESK